MNLRNVFTSGARAFGSPAAIIGIPIACLIPIATDTKTFILSVIAITASQIVLFVAFKDRDDDQRRDVALHAKIDELIIATEGARDDLTHLEDQTEDQIEHLRT